MVTYKSAKSRTFSIGRLQITAETGVTLGAEDETLEQLVKEGLLVKEPFSTTEKEPVAIIATTAKEAVVAIAPKVKPPIVTTKSK